MLWPVSTAVELIGASADQGFLAEHGFCSLAVSYVARCGSVRT